MLKNAIQIRSSKQYHIGKDDRSFLGSLNASLWDMDSFSSAICTVRSSGFLFASINKTMCFSKWDDVRCVGCAGQPDENYLWAALLIKHVLLVPSSLTELVITCCCGCSYPPEPSSFSASSLSAWCLPLCHFAHSTTGGFFKNRDDPPRLQRFNYRAGDATGVWRGPSPLTGSGGGGEEGRRVGRHSECKPRAN